MAVRDVTSRESVAEAFTNTYGGERPGWERVQEYQRVLEYSANHPEKGSSAVSNALDLPRGRIRPWMEERRKPDPMRGLQTAATLGWIDLDWERPPFTLFNVLVAWIFASGSINSKFVPGFTIDRPEAERLLIGILDELELEYRIERADEPGRATEIIPREFASILGRLLVALGAPRGEKNRTAKIEVPSYLSNAPRAVRLDFARTYVWLRGSKTGREKAWPLQLSEARNPEFKLQLRAVFRSLLENPNSVAGSPEARVTYLDRDAVELFYCPPELGISPSETAREADGT